MLIDGQVGGYECYKGSGKGFQRGGPLRCFMGD